MKLRYFFLVLFVALLIAAHLDARAQSSYVVVANAAHFGQMSANTIAVAFPFDGAEFTTVTEQSTTLPLPQQLAGVRVFIDRAPVGLFFVSPRQVNFLTPLGLSPGAHLLIVATPHGRTLVGEFYSGEQSPGVFTVLGNGTGEAAAVYLRFQIDGSNFGCVVLFATGIQTSKASLIYGGKEYSAQYCGNAPGFDGLKQLNFLIPIGELSVNSIGSFVRVYTTVGYYDSNGFEVKFR